MHSLKAEDLSTSVPLPGISARCPICRHQGVLETLATNDVRASILTATFLLGQRRCPRPQCHAHLFLVCRTSHPVEIKLYPPERFDFDPSNIPLKIQKSFEEAISCQSVSAHAAAAMMIRKTLELLCAERDAKGDNLKERIHNLGKKIIIPNELMQALDDLRLLGNDAAHLEAKTYDDVGKEEVDVALELAKEILKATYQYSSLLGRLKALKK